MKQKIYMLALMISFSLLTSCYPDGADYADETDIVYTAYDKEADFQSKGTYAMPDQIVKITGNYQDNEEIEYINDIYAKPILANIDSNMTAYGWTKVDKDSDPDVVILPAAWSTTYVVYWYDYWCWWDPYYCGGWWYPYPITSSYSSGTLILNMVDPKSEDPNGTRKGIWIGAINGLLSGSYSQNRVNNAVNQAFKQSSYLNTK